MYNCILNNIAKMKKIKSIAEFIKSLHIFKKYHDVTPHWIINKKAHLKLMLRLGFIMEYNNGYFFWRKVLQEFTN